MIAVTVREESIHSSGALSEFHAAVDELERRYGQSDDANHLHNDQLAPPRGCVLVRRLDGTHGGGWGFR